MSFLDEVVTRVRKIEGILETNYGASGRGLHEKVSKVEQRLDIATVKKIRYIATIRNKLLHEDNFNFDGDQAKFIQTCDEVIWSLGRPQPESYEWEVVIHNDSEYVMPLQLKTKEGNPYKSYDLDPNKGRVYKNARHIRIDTRNGKFVEYRLENGNTYKVAWNPDKSCWDVFRIR